MKGHWYLVPLFQSVSESNDSLQLFSDFLKAMIRNAVGT